MKYLFILLCSIIYTTGIHAQVITYEQFRSVIPLVEQEDFKGAFALTDKLLATTDDDSSDVRAIVTYMSLYSAAGMVTKGEMSYGTLDTIMKQYVGKALIMSAHPYVDTVKHKPGSTFNSLQLVRRDGELEGMTVTTNNSGGNILFFEYFKYDDAISPYDFVDKNVRCGGILTSYQLNPNKSKIWVARLHIESAFARVMEKK